MNIAWFTSGDRNMASSRLRAWKIGDVLQQQGHTVTWGKVDDNTDVMVMQKRNTPNDISLMEMCKRQSIRIIYDLDDYIPNLPVQCADVITVDTPAKLALYPNAVIIPDCLDIDEMANLQPEGTARYLEEVVTVSNPENMYHIQNAAAACYQLDISLTVITDTKHHAYAHFDGVQGVAWDVATVDAEIVKHDLFIAPLMFGHPQWSDDWVRSKSANRILKAWGLRMPVAATPIPSFIEAGLVYRAQTVDEWVAALTKLESEEARYYDAGIGLQKANRYRADIIAKQWLAVFEGKL